MKNMDFEGRNNMSEVLKQMKLRRSVRKYKPEMVEHDAISRIVEAGLYAASGMNRQETIIVAVTDPEVRSRLSQTNASIMGAQMDPFYGAPVVLIVLAKKNCFTGIYDGSLVMGNLMLAAHELGIGSCWIHRAKETFELPEWKNWLKSIGVEGEYEGVGHCILGYPAEEMSKDAPRKPGRVFYVK